MPAVVLDRNRVDARSRGPESVECRRVARDLDQRAPARAHHRPEHQVEALKRPVGDHDLLGSGGQAAVREAGGDRLA